MTNYSDVIIAAYADGVKAAANDIRWDGQKTNDPLNGDSASGLTAQSVLENFSVQMDAAVAEEVARRGTDFAAERRALEDAVIDSWYNGYDVYTPAPFGD